MARPGSIGQKRQQSVYRYTQLAILMLVALSAGAPTHAAEQTDAQGTTWTYTYLKAKAGQEAALRRFVEWNWFAMDEIAVEQGLFKGYRLAQNMAPADDETAWDLMVAVEYFGDQSYAEIADAFEAIRSAHKSRPVDGKSFRDLGTVVRSERVRFLGD